MVLLTPEDRAKVIEEAVQLGLTNLRPALLSDMDRRFRAELEENPVPGVQLQLDVDHLNRTTQPVAGELPLRIWLVNAAQQVAALPQAAFFLALARGLPAPPPPSGEDYAEQARHAVGALHQLAAADPALARALDAATRVLDDIVSELGPLMVHKNLQELLLDYQVHSLPIVADALAGPWAQPGPFQSILVDMVGTFTSVLGRARIELERLKDGARERRDPARWLDRLGEEHGRLAAAVRGADAVAAADALREFRAELWQRMSGFSALVGDRFDRLDLTALVAALRGIAADFLPADDARAVDLRETATGFALLAGELDTWLGRYDAWSRLDDDLWDAESDLIYKGEASFALQAFSDRWPQVLGQVSALAGAPPETWYSGAEGFAQGFVASCPLPARPPVSNDARTHFRGFVKSARGRYLEVDQALLSCCIRLEALTDAVTVIGRPR